MVDITSHADGLLLTVRAQPGARRNEVRPPQDGALKVSVTQVAEKGKANSAIIAQLAKSLGIRKSQIQLHSGQTSPQKKFLITGLDMGTLRERISTALKK